MARITVEDCLDKDDSPKELVIVAKERATQLNSGIEPTLEKDNDKNTVISLREIAEEKVKVSELVDGVSKLDKINFESKEEADAANLRKMIMAMSNDIRVLLIKLADRRHNLSTISVLENKKQAKKEYNSFLKKYPSSRLVSAVKLELKQLNSRMARK